MSNWISIDKDLPVPLVKVVLLFPTGATRFGEIVQGKFEPVDTPNIKWTLKPTHWMSLEAKDNDH